MRTDRRKRPDRRRVPHWTEWRWVFGGRRRVVRRNDGDELARIDVYPAPLLGAVVLILGLSALDAGFTLQLLQHGLATEANPLMAALLQTDVRLFVNLKTALTSSSMIVLVLYSQRRLGGILRIEHTVYAIAGLYMLLVTYELALLA